MSEESLYEWVRANHGKDLSECHYTVIAMYGEEFYGIREKALKQDIETLESTIQAQQIIIENLKKPSIVYFPDVGDK